MLTDVAEDDKVAWWHGIERQDPSVGHEPRYNDTLAEVAQIAGHVHGVPGETIFGNPITRTALETACAASSSLFAPGRRALLSG